MSDLASTITDLMGGKVLKAGVAAYPKFKQEVSEAPGKALNQMAQYERDNPAGTVNQALVGGIGATGFGAAKNLYAGAEGLPKFEFSDLGSSVKELPKFFQSMKLSEVLDHPELFKQYPHLADIEVQRMLPTLDNYDKAGQFAKADGKQIIRIKADATPEEARSTLLHEIQHAIQDKEGFAQGTHGDAEGYMANPGEMEARAVQGRMGLSQAALDASPIRDFIMKMEKLKS